jgi:single-strand DNA-binding protein
MRGINKVILIGNAGKDPELKNLQDGTPVAKLTVATSETYRLKDGHSSTITEWHPVILWRGLATLASQYIQKGSHVYIEGKLRHRQFEDKEGRKHYITEVVADQMVLLDKKTKDKEKDPNEISETPIPF